MVQRELYMQKVRRLMDKDIIKVITGVRRCGKSYLLNLIIDEITRNGVNKDNILLINFDYPEFKYLESSIELDEFVIDYVKKRDEKVYLFFDEIQYVKDWEKSISGFYAAFDCDIYITGSNFKLLSSELSTLLTGRFMEIKVYPFSFNEFIAYKQELYGVDININKLFNEYVDYGGFPFSAKLESEIDKLEYLSDLYKSIFYSDLIKRYNINNIGLLEKLLSFIIENTGNFLSIGKITNYLKHENIKFSRNTIYNYMNFFENSILIKRVNREDIKGKKILNVLEKNYIIDTGFVKAIIGSNNINIGRLYENIVYLELLRHGYEINIGITGKYEVDFICRKGDEKLYIQVCYLLASESIVEREFRPLMEIRDNYPKYVISMDSINFSKEGIIHMNLIDFLVNFI